MDRTRFLQIVDMDEQRQNTFNQLPTLDRVSASIEVISREVITLKQELQDQRNENNNVIMAVVIAALLVFITIGVEIILFHTR